MRGSATPCKLARTSLAIAAVRRPLPFCSNEPEKTRRGVPSRFPGPFDIHRITFAVLHKPPSRRRIVCSFLFSPHGRSCILFAKAGKSRVLRILRLSAPLPGVGSSTKKRTISPWLFVVSTHFAFPISPPVAPNSSSTLLNFQPLTKFAASLERKLRFPTAVRKIPRDQPAREQKFAR